MPFGSLGVPLRHRASVAIAAALLALAALVAILPWSRPLLRLRLPLGARWR